MEDTLSRAPQTEVENLALENGRLDPPSSGDGTGKKELSGSQSAAVELQRHFRGHKVRRNIADAATMAQKYGWWDVVEGAMLESYSSQFYAYNTPQTAAQRWLRLKKKAAKVGKGLSKNEKARKLALQHWLEAIDPKHRYGHNLHFYYEEWQKCKTVEPFFYWLDVGEGKDVVLEACKRSKLHSERIRYLGPKERKIYEVVIEDGKLISKFSGEPVDTPKGNKWIFVMSTSGKLYVGKKEKGKLQHSSFLAGGATTAAGRLLVKDGTIELMEAHSGHYHPTPENFKELVTFLTTSGADLTMAQVRYQSDDMLCNSSKSFQPVEGQESHEAMSTVEEVVDIVDTTSKAIQGDGDSAQVMVSLTLEEDENTRGAETITVMEGSPSGKVQEQDNLSDEEIEGDKSLPVSRTSNGTDLPENQDAMKRDINKIRQETIKLQLQDQRPSEEVQADRPRPLDGAPKDAAPIKRSPTMPAAPRHRLYTPALQAFCKLEGRPTTSTSTPDLGAQGSESELTPNSRRLLLRRLSMSTDLVTST